MSTYSIIAIVVFNTIRFPAVNGHGMMMDPVSRASRWRVGFRGPKEYTDNQLSCGGRNVQWGKHNGKCGACGDEYGIRNPKFTYPGPFASNPPIVKEYNEGAKIDVKIKITANHKGYFTFRIAPLKKPPIKQHELDKIMLELENGDAEWPLTSPATKYFTIPLQLPMGLTCDHCVLQWWWSTGNNHINDKPESFVNCADIAIRRHGDARPSSKPKPKPTRRPPPRPKRSKKPTRPSGKGKGCRSVKPWVSAAMDVWCKQHCALGDCPQSQCICE